MGFIVLAAGLRIPGLLEVLALGPALDAKKSESDSGATEDHAADFVSKLPGSSLALLAASASVTLRLRKGPPGAVESFEYLAILLAAQILYLVVLLWLGRQRWVGCLLLTLYGGCLVWVLTRFYLTVFLWSGRE